MQKQRNLMSQMLTEEGQTPTKQLASMLYKGANLSPKQLVSLKAFKKEVEGNKGG